MTFSIECRYAECRYYLNYMASVITPNAVMPSVVATKKLICQLYKMTPKDKFEVMLQWIKDTWTDRQTK